MQERHIHLAHKLYKVLRLSFEIENLTEAIESRTDSFIERYNNVSFHRASNKMPRASIDGTNN